MNQTDSKNSKKPQKSQKAKSSKPSYSEIEKRLEIAIQDCTTVTKKLRACELRCADIINLINNGQYGRAMTHFVRLHDFVLKAMQKPYEDNVSTIL